jgi:hypothetical protein
LSGDQLRVRANCLGFRFGFGLGLGLRLRLRLTVKVRVRVEVSGLGLGLDYIKLGTLSAYLQFTIIVCSGFGLGKALG